MWNHLFTHRYHDLLRILPAFEKLIESKALYCERLCEKDVSALSAAEQKRHAVSIRRLEEEIELLNALYEHFAQVDEAHNQAMAGAAADRRNCDLVSEAHTVALAGENLLIQLLVNQFHGKSI